MIQIAGRILGKSFWRFRYICIPIECIENVGNFSNASKIKIFNPKPKLGSCAGQKDNNK